MLTTEEILAIRNSSRDNALDVVLVLAILDVGPKALRRALSVDQRLVGLILVLILIIRCVTNRSNI